MCFYSQVLLSPPLAVFFLLYFFDFSFLEFAFTPSFPVSPVESPSLCSVIFIGYFQFYFGSFVLYWVYLPLSCYPWLVPAVFPTASCIYCPSLPLLIVVSSQSCVLPCSIVPVVLVVRLLVCDHLANCFWTHLEQPAKKVPFPFPLCSATCHTAVVLY